MCDEIDASVNGRGYPRASSGMVRMCRRTSAAIKRVLVCVCAASVCGCATVAQVTNLSQSACAMEFREGISAILVEQGETKDSGEALGGRTLSVLTTGALGPRPFLVASPSGTDYEFFVEKKSDRCLLRLYGRQHGFVSYTNNLTYIATRPLTSCECAE